jgi:hypothetical protein
MYNGKIVIIEFSFSKRLIQLDSICERSVGNGYCNGRVVYTFITVRMGEKYENYLGSI